MQGGAQVENMEGAAFFALAKECGFRAVQIRAISNRVGESFENWHLDEALGALAKVLQTLTL
jgi:adenosylhomocysteine nucleosidase/futalosine hydrolase